MSTALQLCWALLWWIVVAALAACLGLATLVVCVTASDWWRERHALRDVRALPEVTERTVRR